STPTITKTTKNSDGSITYETTAGDYTVTTGSNDNFNAPGQTLVGMGTNYAPGSGIVAGGSSLGNWLQGNVPLIGGILARVAAGLALGQQVRQGVTDFPLIVNFAELAS